MATKKTDKFDSFLHDGLSIDESKTSVLIITYLVSFLTAIVFCIVMKDIESLKAVYFSNIAAITGINVTNSITHANTKKYEYTTQPDSSNDYEPKG